MDFALSKTLKISVEALPEQHLQQNEENQPLVEEAQPHE